MAAKALIGRKVERAMTINEGGAPSSQLSHHCGPPQSLFAFCEKERSAQAFGKDSRDRSYIPQMLRLAGWKEEKCDWGSHNCRLECGLGASTRVQGRMRRGVLRCHESRGVVFVFVGHFSL